MHALHLRADRRAADQTWWPLQRISPATGDLRAPVTRHQITDVGARRCGGVLALTGNRR